MSETNDTIKYLEKINYPVQQSDGSFSPTDFYLHAVSLATYDSSGNPIAQGLIPSANGSGGLTWFASSAGVSKIGSLSGNVNLGVGLRANNDTNAIVCCGMEYSSTNPRTEVTSGYQVAILDSSAAPTASTAKAGWLYYILE